ncbi:NADPH-dependent FMN reductase [Lacinutrix chionoecetis]
MKNILVFAGSNSKTSINKQLATYASNKIDDAIKNVLDLNDFKIPLFGVDLEKEKGIPEDVNVFLGHINEADGIILSLAEHNGAYSTAFKNLFDWLSRVENKFFGNKPLLLMATSPGSRGGKSVLEIAKDRFPRHDAAIVDTFSLPSFNENFSHQGIQNDLLEEELNKKIEIFKKRI